MKEFELLFVTLEQFEHLAVEIQFRGQRLCRINKERGNDDMEIEFLSDLYLVPIPVQMVFPLKSFFNTIATAKAELLKCP